MTRGKEVGVNSRNKGKRGEREFAALLSEHGFHARRGQQFSGGADSPDVVSEALAWLHVEVKRAQNLNLTDACVQAEGDQTRSGLNGVKKLAWIVAHRRNHAPWLITMRAETFFQLLRGELPPVAASLATRADGTDSTPHPSPLPDRGGEGASRTGDDGAHGTARPTGEDGGRSATRPNHEAARADACPT
jgi:hypothetical protein